MKKSLFLCFGILFLLVVIHVGCTKEYITNNYNNYGDTTIIMSVDTVHVQPVENIIYTDNPDPAFFTSSYNYGIARYVMITKNDLDSMELLANGCESYYQSYDSSWHYSNCGSWYRIQARKYWGQKISSDGNIITYLSVGKDFYGIGPSALSFGIGKINQLGVALGYKQENNTYNPYWQTPVPYGTDLVPTFLQ